jgi:hypothetical protein
MEAMIEFCFARKVEKEISKRNTEIRFEFCEGNFGV